MSKRVHEIAKERGLPAKEVLEKLRAAGINVKAVSSSVDEAAAAKALGNGATPGRRQRSTRGCSAQVRRRQGARRQAARS